MCGWWEHTQYAFIPRKEYDELIEHVHSQGELITSQYHQIELLRQMIEIMKGKEEIKKDYIVNIVDSLSKYLEME